MSVNEKNFMRNLADRKAITKGDIGRIAKSQSSKKGVLDNLGEAIKLLNKE